MALTTNLRAFFSEHANSNDSLATYNGTNVNSPTYTAGNLGNALTLASASSQYASMPNGVLPFGTNVYTVNIWLKITTLPASGTGMSLSMTARTGQGLLLYAFNNAGTYAITHSKPNVVDLNYTWTADTNWHMWTFTGDGSGMATYKDGNATPVATNANTSNIVAPSTDTIEFGAYRSGGSIQAGWYMEGQMQLIGVWDRAITTTEISQLWNGGAGFDYPFSSTSIKTVDGLAYASAKTVNGLAVASVKTIDGLA